MTAGILLASLLALAGLFAYRRRERSRANRRPAGASAPVTAGTPMPMPRTAGPPTAGPPIDLERVRTASDLAAQRLWRLAFGAPAEAPPLPAAQGNIRHFIHAVLEVDTLDPNYFPRRPALMPQLLQVANDPAAQADKLSRMIAHDPVLTADVLRIANSGLYRTSPAPIETVKRAIVVCGIDALRGILAAAMLRPVFRASRNNFPRLPRLLWERTERAARAAELYAARRSPQDRFEAHLLVLLSALGPLVVYSAALDGYSRAPWISPNPSLFVELIDSLGAQMSLRIARDWQTSPRFVTVLEGSGEDPLAGALHVGELFGTLSLLETQTVISREERQDAVSAAGLPEDLAADIWTSLTAVRAPVRA